MPNLCVGADGRVVVSYLSHTSVESSWHLKLATVEVDPSSGDPSIGAKPPCELGEGFGMNPPAFSADGRWVFGIPREQSAVKIVRRYSVAAAFARAGGESRAAR